MAKRKQKIHSLTWHGTLLAIHHTPLYFGHADHIEVLVKKPAKAMLPITETGYRSHFIDPEDLANEGGAVLFVQAWLEREAKTVEWQKRESKLAQLDFLHLLIASTKEHSRKRAI